ncbi:GLPGLI family protein [Flavobacterium flevense]|uniref:GLPGLI family protein n=1 Tax=Flavobacterium flevense TaxID=983 RepID=A0A4Y4AR65_9FLAO|nr:GLPGLI family protein [Flavobacterium flevense]GEC70696.1 GLPGLI family protein [Flavobacterium flevense]SHL51339.1 GLPGLI family protein [Flavobacterium flevense]
MKTILFFITVLFFTITTSAQQFVNKAVIEYEVSTNLKKTMSNDSWDEMMKDNLSDLKISYFNYTFADNKSIFKFDRWSPKTRIPKYLKDADEENSWYFDFNTGMMNMKKQIVGTNFVIIDSIPKIEWKITNENREIAGYNCRKAVGKIMDDVYVFAFYTDDITISGGPCSVNGLPGMILGLTIPRLYTSYIATKVDVTFTNAAEIKTITDKKTYDFAGLKSLIEERTKEWFSYGDNKEENERQKNMFLWSAFL